jgi:hypothetical protein
MLAGPVSAGATTFCVGDPACVTAGGTSVADLGVGLSMAQSNAGPDRVELGVGTFDEAATPFNYSSSDPVEILGEGTGQTVVIDSVPGAFDPVLLIQDSGVTGSSVSALAVEMNIVGQRGITLQGGGSASNVEVRLGVGAPANTIGYVLNNGGSLSNATASLASGAGSLGISLVSTPGATIEDVQLSANSGINIGSTDASAENLIRRARITAIGGAGVSASRGTSTLESSLVRMLSASDLGVSVGNSNFAAIAFDLEVRNTTIIGPGTGVGGTGAIVGATNSAGVQLPSLVLRDSIVSGFATPLRCTDQSAAPPGDDDFPTLTTDYSDYPSAGLDIQAGCLPTFTESNHLTADPMFVNPASDFHLQMSSPLIDAGTPGPLGGSESPTDLDGNPRLVDGNGDNMARRDLGAFERGAPAPPGGGATPAARPRSFFGDLALRARNRKGRLAGALSSDNPACLQGRLIELFRMRKGPDPRVGTVLTRSDGSFRLGRRLPAGRYYGEVDPLSLPGGDSCAAELSARARLRPPP